MKKIFKAGANKLKQFLLLVMSAAVAILAMPFGLINGSRGAVAEVTTGEYDGGTPNVTTSAGESYKLTLHYHREKEDYTGWNLWAWSNGVEGKQYDAEASTLEVITDNICISSCF